MKPPVGKSGPVPPLWGWSRVDGHAHAIDPGGEHPASVSLAPMSDPGRKFLDLLCATVTLGAFRSVLAEVVAVAEEAANLSDEQLRSALVSLDHAARRLVGGEAVSAYWVCSSIDSRADRLVGGLPPGVLRACCGARLPPVAVRFSDRPSGSLVCAACAEHAARSGPSAGWPLVEVPPAPGGQPIPSPARWGAAEALAVPPPRFPHPAAQSEVRGEDQAARSAPVGGEVRELRDCGQRPLRF